MPRFKLRTLLIVSAIGPMVLAGIVYVLASARYWANYRSTENGPPPPTFHRPSP